MGPSTGCRGGECPKIVDTAGSGAAGQRGGCELGSCDIGASSPSLEGHSTQETSSGEGHVGPLAV